jgi:hypothetical protein
LFLTFPYFNSQDSVAATSSIQAPQNEARSGKIIFLNAATGTVRDDVTGIIYQISNYRMPDIFEGDKVIFNFDPAFAGKVIVRAVTR